MKTRIEFIGIEGATPHNITLEAPPDYEPGRFMEVNGKRWQVEEVLGVVEGKSI